MLFLLLLIVFFLVKEAPNLSFSLGEFSEIWGFFVSGFFSFLLIFVSVFGEIHGVVEKEFSHFLLRYCGARLGFWDCLLSIYPFHLQVPLSNCAGF